MRAATVEDVAQEFMRILAEGWSPDPEEFLHRVPEDLREDCRARLEELIEAADGDSAEQVEHVEEAVETFEGAEDEVIVFELGNDGPIQTVKVPSVEMPAEEVEEAEAEELAYEPELDEASFALAIETALQPEEPETAEIEEPEAAVEEPETAEIEEPEAVIEEPETAEVEELPVAIEEAETAEIEEPEVEEPVVEDPEVDELSAEQTFFTDLPAKEPVAIADPAVEPETAVEPEPEPEPEPKPQGLVKLSREEAKAMFEAMERNRE